MLRALTAALVLLLAAPGWGAGSQVLARSVASKTGRARDLTIILPAGYDPRTRYPVLYLMDGQNLLGHPFHPGGWRAETGLAQAMQHGAAPMIIVGVHAQDRMNEYTAVRDPAHGGGGASAFLQHLTDEVVPFVDAHFATRTDRQGRAIGGSSLGGLAAMNALLHRGDVFARGLVMSPSVWWANRHLLGEVGRSPSIAGQRLVLYNGGPNDGQANAEQLRDLLHAKGMAFNQSLFHWTEPGASHDERAWAHFLPRGLGALFPR